MPAAVTSSRPRPLSHDLLGHRPHQLDPIFSPKVVAVIGATENPGAVGRTVMSNLLRSPFGGPVFPVNPKRPSVLGVKAYKSIGELPEKPDLIVVCTPAQAVPGIIKEAAEQQIPGAVVISAGFKELGPPGEALEKQLLEYARPAGMRIVGPNCLGVMNPVSGLNATFANGVAKAGTVGFLSQSGALMTAVLDWSFREKVGFSKFASIGSMLDVDWGDLISYLGDDPRTQSIVIYMETVGDARSFLSAAREVALSKPIIVIKAGRTAQAAKAAASHTGSLAGSDSVLDAALERVGVLRVDTIAQLFEMAEVLGKQPRPKGPRLTILTNAGGPGVLATDSLVSHGGQLAELSAQTMAELNGFLPPHWSRGNPVDVLGDADASRYARALEICSRDQNSDGLMVILTPQDMTEPTQTAQMLVQAATAPAQPSKAPLTAVAHQAQADGLPAETATKPALASKPILAAWMGGPFVAAGEDILNAANIPTFAYPDSACQAFCYMWKYADNLRALYETPALPAGADEIDRDAAGRVIDAALKSGRTLLTEFESKALLFAYGIPTVRTLLAETADDAVQAADEIGYPVVVKLHSYTITHKTDVGGVQLNLRDANAVREAFELIRQNVSRLHSADEFNGVTVQPMAKLDGYELIIGSSLDAQFGPVLLFGTGGQLVEVFKDSALALPPLTATLARRLIDRTKIATALRGVRGRSSIDMTALEALLVRFSQLVVEQPRIVECDINPLLASPDQLIALDGRVVLHPLSVPDSDLPKPAIRPYPTNYVERWAMKDGTSVLIRPIRPEDEPAMVAFHEGLSERSVRLRYFQQLKLSSRVAHDRLARVCFNDYDRELALVVEAPGTNGQARQIIGVARLSKLVNLGGDEAEFAVVVADAWQHKGLGRHLLSRVVDIARQEGVKRLSAAIMTENTEMQKIATALGFHLSEPEDGVLAADLQL